VIGISRDKQLPNDSTEKIGSSRSGEDTDFVPVTAVIPKTASTVACVQLIPTCVALTVGADAR
jgi:hypothetical protein